MAAIDPKTLPGSRRLFIDAAFRCHLRMQGVQGDELALTALWNALEAGEIEIVLAEGERGEIVGVKVMPALKIEATIR
jgi:hypothetical protein